MAFQLCKLAFRLKLSKSAGTWTIPGNQLLCSLGSKQAFANRPTPRALSTFARGGECSAKSRLLNSAPAPNQSRVINIAKRWDKFSTTSLTSQSLQRQSAPKSKRRGVFSQPITLTLGALGLSAAVVAAVCFHTTRDMSAHTTGKSDSDKTDESTAKSSAEEPLFKSNDAIAQKVSVFRGDITKLEIDAIVNAANKTLLGGGGVDGAIHRGAGPLLKKECSTLGGCETGEAKITGAYGLPAKYVIHTVGPIALGSVGDGERRALRDCYFNSLRLATDNDLRTVAFPCISTGVYGYPPEQAVEVALRTVREYLEEQHTKLDRVIFCVFLKSDEELYEKRLPVYFPQGTSPKSKL